MARSFIAKLAPFSLVVAACSGSETSAGGAGSGGTAGIARGGSAGTGARGGSAGAEARGGSAGTGADIGGEAGASGEGGGPAGAAGEAGQGSGYCGERTPDLVEGSGTPVSPATPLSETPIDASECGAVEREFPLEDPIHVDLCTEIAYSANPPCTGQHYGIWPQFRIYDQPIPRGFWVHALEHGAVVIGYSCTDSACAGEVELAAAMLDEVGDDPLCVAGGRPSRRAILVPDPRLDTRWAASSWGYTLTADCFEAEVFRSFLLNHRGQGPEAVCSDGLDVTQGG